MLVLRTLIRGIFFFTFCFGLSAGLGFVTFGRIGAGVGLGLMASVLAWNALRWKSLWKKALRGRRVQIVREVEIYHLNDPSSHFFLLKSPLGSGGSIFMTRGILTLLTPEELDTLILQCERRMKDYGWGWNTFISSLQLRLMKLISSDMRQFFYGSPSAAEPASLSETLRSLPWLGLIDFLRRFLVPLEKLSAPAHPLHPQILDKLLAESYTCPPHLPAAVSVHALVDPWPKALLRTSEPCPSGKSRLTLA